MRIKMIRRKKAKSKGKYLTKRKGGGRKIKLNYIKLKHYQYH